jgi:hypothetical protein
MIMGSRSDRARGYREQAAELRAIAAKEPQGSIIQDQLLKLAEEYDRLATQIEGTAP